MSNIHRRNTIKLLCNSYTSTITLTAKKYILTCHDHGEKSKEDSNKEERGFFSHGDLPRSQLLDDLLMKMMISRRVSSVHRRDRRVRRVRHDRRVRCPPLRRSRYMSPYRTRGNTAAITPFITLAIYYPCLPFLPDSLRTN